MANSSENSDFTSLKSLFSDVCCYSCTVHDFNIRSIRKYWDQFKVIAESIKPAVDIFFLTEINVPNVSRTKINLNGYSAFFRTCQLGRGGGIAVFIRNKWIVSHITAQFDSAECVALKIYYGNCTITLLGLYRPPSANVLSFLTELKYNLEELRGEGNICFIGAFNIDSLKSTKSSVWDYLTLLSSYGIECRILAPTQQEIINEKLVSSCIDQIYIRSSYRSAKSTVISQKLADHYFITCQLSNNYPKDNNRDIVSMYRLLMPTDLITWCRLMIGYLY